MKVKTYSLKDLDTGFIYNFRDKKQLDQALDNYPNHTIIENYENI